ncbi:trypsin-like serine protease [Arthrobacter sp. KBS0703]|uniref:S1 family peptidase n=1 Tax=Arthrobacter sp. KBS0703 TaxID=1955698 RepID=UPI00098FACAF|nr:trypsin-like serine protease [Arthrobacter sp. KBS0703]TSE17787.1 trypsin-like serine protease [Arthrobacter sp. KBS0703]
MKIAKLLAAAAAAALLLMPANSATAAPAEDSTVHKNIAGGSTTSVSAAPFAAQVSFDAAGTRVGCAGSQISASWVITAKHCNSTSLRSVRLGSTYLQSGGTVRTVAARYASPMGDVLLLKLSAPHYGTYVGLSGSFPASGEAAKVYGWGYQSEGSGAMSYFLKAADVTVTGQGSDPSGGPTVTTRSRTGHTLNGDSGGPLIVNGKLTGVLSTSSILPAQNPSDYTGYTNDHASVARNLSWITSVSGVPGS